MCPYFDLDRCHGLFVPPFVFHGVLSMQQINVFINGGGGSGDSSGSSNSSSNSSSTTCSNISSLIVVFISYLISTKCHL